VGERGRRREGGDGAVVSRGSDCGARGGEVRGECSDGDGAL
jgi:hypothetical protein